jgi:hydrogenase expression/formation protein HypE
LREHILPRLGNPALAPLTDSAVLEPPPGRLCFTTDGYVVQPLFFPGGDIGRLCVCGTVNDLAVMGANPLAISLSLVMEEGLPLASLDAVLDSIAAAAREAGVAIVTGDTKVVERQRGDGLIITTAGIGVLRPDCDVRAARIAAGDALLINGAIAEHGLAVMSAREGLAFKTEIRSDVAPLNGLIAAVLDAGIDIRFMRDATRGGVAGVLADISAETGLSVAVEEAAVPITRAARHASELLGLDPLSVANEGKCLFVVAHEQAGRTLEILRAHPLGAASAMIGAITAEQPPLAELFTRAGGRRIVVRPYGEELPRIC